MYSAPNLPCHQLHMLMSSLHMLKNKSLTWPGYPLFLFWQFLIAVFYHDDILNYSLSCDKQGIVQHSWIYHLSYCSFPATNKRSPHTAYKESCATGCTCVGTGLGGHSHHLITCWLGVDWTILLEAKVDGSSRGQCCMSRTFVLWLQKGLSWKLQMP